MWLLGTSDGWTDLRDDHAMDWHSTSAPNGNVVQTGRLKVDGTGQPHAMLALGFGGTTSAALSGAQASLAPGFRLRRGLALPVDLGERWTLPLRLLRCQWR